MSIDIVDGTLIWETGSPAFVPPVPPIPVEGGGDGVALPGLPPGMLVSTTAYERRRSRLDDLPNPWIAILRWLRRIDETRTWEADYWRQVEIDDLDILELTRLSGKRQ